jgi:hypothetical protein
MLPGNSPCWQLLLCTVTFLNVTNGAYTALNFGLEDGIAVLRGLCSSTVPHTSKYNRCDASLFSPALLPYDTRYVK